MTRTRRVAVLAAALAVLASLAVAANVSASRNASPIVIGWAHDSIGQHGAVRQPGARSRPDPREADQRQGRGQRPTA